MRSVLPEFQEWNFIEVILPETNLERVVVGSPAVRVQKGISGSEKRMHKSVEIGSLMFDLHTHACPPIKVQAY